MAMLSMPRMHLPWHVTVESVSGKTRVVNANNEVVCEMMIGHESQAEPIKTWANGYASRQD
jgi:hypothetical protein